MENKIPNYLSGRSANRWAWILAPTTDTVSPDKYQSSHSAGGNVLSVGGSIAWHEQSTFKMYKTPVIWLDYTTDYFYEPWANTFGQIF